MFQATTYIILWPVPREIKNKAFSYRMNRQFTQQCTPSNYLKALTFTTALDTPFTSILHSDLSVELFSKKIRNILLLVHIVAN